MNTEQMREAFECCFFESRNDHGDQIDTQHPGPITMDEPEDNTRWDVYGAVLLVGILCGFGLVFAGGQIAELAALAGR